MKETIGLTCPECGATFRDARGTGSHRLRVHGIAGSSPSVIAYHKKKEAEKKAAKKALRERLKGAQKAPAPRPAAPAPPAPPPAAPQPVNGTAMSMEMAAYAAGKLESMAEQIARENGLPAREFVARTAECLVALSRRRG